ncbi:sigma-70 family RNA polymerase sigma factor [Planctomicrobium sp. SH664]|uniref:sigma-70 family RNA polymerase sigma factor n=1 Tax=Planctomicrobium sp. SH664 TaxID=3448125 RepID=UPI003F5BD87B
MKSDDQRLIESTLAGNRNAFGELVLKYQDRIYGTLVHLLGSQHDARDVSQEAFLLAYEKLGSFRQEASFYSWLFRIAYNAAISNRRRKGHKSQSLNSNHSQRPAEPSDPSLTNDPANRMQVEEHQHQVRLALETLGPEYRDAIILKEIEGLRYEEIAEIQDCPIGTVRSRIHRARQLLRERLARVVEREQKS